MPDPLFSCRKLTIARANKAVLHKLDWQILPGEHWMVTGPNAAGKSTLVEAITGRHRLLAGERSWPGLVGNRSEAIRLVSFTDTGHLFHNANAVHYYQQRFNAFDADGHLTVKDYLLANGHSQASALATLQDLHAEELLGLERIKLSSGQTRKLLLAKAMTGSPRLLIIDNPYLGLDAGSRQRLNDLLDQLAARKRVSLVLVSPQMNTPPTCISHHLELTHGRAAYAGPQRTTQPLAEEPTSEAEYAGLRRFFTRGEEPGQEQGIVRLEEVTVAYGGKVILDKLNWQVRSGEKWVVAGNNGSGKSTLVSLLYGDHPQAYANRIFLFGNRRGRGESIWDVKRRIGFTSPELHAFFDGSLTAREVILSGLNDTFSPPKKPAETALASVKELLRFANLSQPDSTPFRSFSTGEQRLLLLLRALIKAPPVLLLDEPFQGMDERTIRRCRRLLDLVLTEDRTLIFISHFKEEVPDGVDRILKLAG